MQVQFAIGTPIVTLVYLIILIHIIVNHRNIPCIKYKKNIYNLILINTFLLGTELESNNVIFSSSSPFKVTTEENIVPQSVQMEINSVNRNEKILIDLSADYQPAQKLLDLSADYQPAQKDKVLGRYNMCCITMWI